MRKSILYNQNFFKDQRLVTEIVRAANFGPSDVVYEIGPGKGIITSVLAEAAGQVVAVEIDQKLWLSLKQKFATNPKVKLINADFLQYRIPDANFKVFSNIPFNLTAEIVRKLLASPGLTEAYLVVQKEAGGKFSGIPKETQFSILNKPWFEFEVVRAFKKTDFVPVPSVDTVLLKITKRQKPLVAVAAKNDYSSLVQLGFNRWRANLGKNLKQVLTYKQWQRLAHDLKFPVRALPTDLTFDQWLGIFNLVKNVLK
ncbi:MAG: 23S ribosomal RNA methyltransferase Erm [Patescibacteria group bacterium]|nr:23S ribosomal RNA methyltransferase Erm [Patescibacteria group bacterium]